MHKGETGGNPVVNYNFTFLDRERYSQSKKKLEVRKSEKLAAALARFDPSTAVEVIAIGLPDSTLRAMANTLELDDEERMARSLEDLCGQYPRYPPFKSRLLFLSIFQAQEGVTCHCGGDVEGSTWAQGPYHCPLLFGRDS